MSKTVIQLQRKKREKKVLPSAEKSATKCTEFIRIVSKTLKYHKNQCHRQNVGCMYKGLQPMEMGVMVTDLECFRHDLFKEQVEQEG